MKKAGNILLIVGIVTTIFSIIGLVIALVIFFIFADPAYKNDIINMINSGQITSSFSGTVEEQATQIQFLFKVIGIVFVIISVGYLLNVISPIVAIKKGSKTAYVITLIFGIIFFNLFILIGSILGLVDDTNQ